MPQANEEKMMSKSEYISERKDDYEYYRQRARTCKRLFGKRCDTHLSYLFLAIQARKDYRAGRQVHAI